MRFRMIAITLVLSMFASPVATSAGDGIFAHRQRSRSKGSLPRYDYGKSVWPFTLPSSFGTSAIAVAATDPTESGKTVKSFHFRSTALTVNHLRLDQVGLSLHKSTGQLFASGRIMHDGGDGGLIGNNVTVRVHVYVAPTSVAAPKLQTGLDGDQDLVPIATPNDVNQIPPDAYCIHTFKRSMWVSRGRPQQISLMDPTVDLADRRLLRRHFGKITHLKVELEYQRDR